MEEFRDIPWYEWIYQISNLWTVKNIIKNNIIKNFNDWKWYFQTTIYKNKIRKTYKTHILVAKTFIENPENKLQINHKNGIKSDNRLVNLERCTQSENQIHRFKVLWHKSNFQINHPYKDKIWKYHPKSKKINQYDLNNNIIKKWDCISDVTRKLWIDGSSISKCCRWKLKIVWWYIFKYIIQ